MINTILIGSFQDFFASKWIPSSLQWRHNERDGVSNYQHLNCLPSCWFRRRSKETAKLRVTGLCAGNSPVTGEFPAQRTSNAVNISTWWRHHVSAAIREMMYLGSNPDHTSGELLVSFSFEMFFCSAPIVNLTINMNVFMYTCIRVHRHLIRVINIKTLLINRHRLQPYDTYLPFHISLQLKNTLTWNTRPFWWNHEKTWPYNGCLLHLRFQPAIYIRFDRFIT